MFVIIQHTYISDVRSIGPNNNDKNLN